MKAWFLAAPVAVVAAVVLTSEGCGSNSSSTCTSGQIQTCTAASGCLGSQTCGANGTFGTCVCAGNQDAGSNDSGTRMDSGSGSGMDSGNADSGSGTDAGGNDSGMESDSGTGMDSGTATDSGTGVDSGTGTDAGTGNDAGTGADAGGNDGGSNNFAFPFPPVVANGGPLITAPKLVTVTFSGETMATQLDSFGMSLTSSAYWDAIRNGYCIGTSCIGDGTGSSASQATAAAGSYTDSASGGPSSLQTALAGLITGGKVPMPDANTIYMLYFPSTTTISLDGAASCQVFFGYHNQMQYMGQTVVYAVNVECPSGGSLSLLDETTITASHEAMESASDGVFTNTGNGFYLDLNNPATWGWNDVLGGEIGDLCVDIFGLGQDETTENGFTVQRIWSIVNAAAHQNPCVPIPAGEVYFNAYSSDSVVVLDVGHTTTIQVDALADGAMTAWNVEPRDFTDPTGATTYLQLQFEGADAGASIQLSSGQSAKLNITMLMDPTNATQSGGADGVVVSFNNTATTATAAHFWPFIVMTSSTAGDAGVTTMRPRFEAPPRKTWDSRGWQLERSLPRQ